MTSRLSQRLGNRPKRENLVHSPKNGRVEGTPAPLALYGVRSWANYLPVPSFSDLKKEGDGLRSEVSTNATGLKVGICEQRDFGLNPSFIPHQL